MNAVFENILYPTFYFLFLGTLFVHGYFSIFCALSTLVSRKVIDSMPFLDPALI